MVIADNHINALLRSISHFAHRLDTTVQCDNQLTALLNSIINTLERNTITFGVAIGDVVVYIGYWVLDIGRCAIGYWVLGIG